MSRSASSRPRPHGAAIGLPAAVLLATTALVTSSGCEPVMATLLDVDRVDSARLRRWIAGIPKPILLDVRDSKSFAQGHVPGAVSLRPSQVDAYMANLGVTRERVVVTICYHGRLSVVAGAVVRSRGFARVYSLRGGMAAWRARGLPLARGPGPRHEPRRLRLPPSSLSKTQQALAAGSTYVLAPMVLLVALALLFWLRRRSEPGMPQLRRGLLLLSLGQVGLVLGVVFGAGLGGPLESVRSICSVLAVAALASGLFVLAGSFRAQRGEGDRVAGRHWGWVCVALVLGLLAILPWTASIRPLHRSLGMFGTNLLLTRDVWLLLLELRIYPSLAAVLLLTGAALLLVGGPKAKARSRLPLFLGAALLAHALLRGVLLRALRESPAWLLFWEQAVGLVVVAVGAAFLRAHGRATTDREAGGR
ncbi:MAG: rhodanese-like domain-containing protein [bacterium]